MLPILPRNRTYSRRRHSNTASPIPLAFSSTPSSKSASPAGTPSAASPAPTTPFFTAAAPAAVATATATATATTAATATTTATATATAAAAAAPKNGLAAHFVRLAPPRRRTPATKRKAPSTSSPRDKEPKRHKPILIQQRLPLATQPQSSTAKEQTFLDLGQDDFSAYECPDCKMVYCPGAAEEEALHAKVHAKHMAVTEKRHALALGTRDLRAAASTVVKAAPLRGDPAAAPVSIVRLDYPRAPRFASRVIAFVDAQLQAAPLASARSVDLDQLALYLAVTGPRATVAAILIAHPITTAFRAVDASTYDASTPVAAACGVSRMWCAPTHRGRGLMTAVMDAILASFAYQAILDPLHDVAFTQLTTSGFAFASAYLSAHKAAAVRAAELDAARRGLDGGSDSDNDADPPRVLPLVFLPE